jgi:hypothetical protein
MPTPARFAKPGAFVAALAAVWLILYEISTLSGGFLSVTGEHAKFNELGGPKGWSAREHWRDVFTRGQLDAWDNLLFAYLLVDLIFIGLFTWALLSLNNRLPEEPPVRYRRIRRHLVLALMATDLAEDLVQGLAGWRREPDAALSEGWALTLGVLSTLKWLLVLGVLISFVAWMGSQRRLTVRRRARELSAAVFLQRFSLAAFLPLALLAVLPLAWVSNLFDQLPDAQRAWIESGQGVVHAFAAAVFYAGVVLAIFVLGRLRADWAYRRAADKDWPYWYPPNAEDGKKWPRTQSAWFWIAAPLVFFALAVFVEVADIGDVFWWRFIVFSAVPILVLLVSKALERWGSFKPDAHLPKRGGSYARDVMAVGDVVAVAAVSLAGFGLIRAFTGEAGLAVAGLLEDGSGNDRAWSFVALVFLALLFGVAVAVVPWLASYPVLESMDQLHTDPEAKGPQNGRRWLGRVGGRVTSAAEARLMASRMRALLKPGVDVYEPGEGQEPTRDLAIKGFLAAGLTIFVLLASFPEYFAYALAGVGMGMIGAVVLALGSLMVTLGCVMAYAQARQPPALFLLPVVLRGHLVWRAWTRDERPPDGRWWRPFRATPVISLLVVAAVLASIVGRRTDVHPVVGDGPLPPRPTVTAAFDRWVQDGEGCRVPYPGHASFSVRPMLMFAAEGGGIRATYWTAAALQRLGDQVPCARSSTLLSGGASGGALGLTLARFDPDPLPLAEEMSAPDALSVASLSLLSGDLLASSVGIRFDADTPYRKPEEQSLDRAGLMAAAWENELEALRTRFLPNPPQSDPPAATEAISLDPR